MVCLGNICRSPLAHGIMEQMAKEKGLNWQIDSAGTGNWHVGEGPDYRSTRTARMHGIDISDQVCRLFRERDFEDFDHILVMDRSNLQNVLAMALTQQDKQKVQLLLGDKEVPDPYHDDTLFEPVFQLITKGCAEFVKDHASE
jgi:protein-tyrosine phosphatase